MEYIQKISTIPFVDLGKAHNISVDYCDYWKVYDTDQYNGIVGLQYCVMKDEEDNNIFWDKYGPFEYEKDANGNYVRWSVENIIRNQLAYPKVEERQGDYIFKNGKYIKDESGNYIKKELTGDEKAPEIPNFFMNYLFK